MNDSKIRRLESRQSGVFKKLATRKMAMREMRNEIQSIGGSYNLEGETAGFSDRSEQPTTFMYNKMSLQQNQPYPQRSGRLV